MFRVKKNRKRIADRRIEIRPRSYTPSADIVDEYARDKNDIFHKATNNSKQESNQKSAKLRDKKGSMNVL